MRLDLYNLRNFPAFLRRRRISRPWTLVVFGCLFLMFPFLNYASAAIAKRIPLSQFGYVIQVFSVFEILLISFSFVVGFGLLSVKKWGWWAFLGYSGVFIIRNIVAIVKNPVMYNFGALVETIFAFIAITYFLQKDISAPYFKMYPRGWRGEKRVPVRKKVKIGDFETFTRDLSQSGLFANFPNCKLEINSEIMIELEGEKDVKRLRGGVVNINEVGVGIAFREIKN